MIDTLLARRALPPLFPEKLTARNWPARRAEMLETLSEQVYGHTPAAPRSVSVTRLSLDENACAGKARQESLRLGFEADFGAFEFPFELITPKDVPKAPCFVLLNFDPAIPHKYLPIEEIIDRGYAVARIFYEDVVNDRYRGDFSDGLGLVYYQGRARGQSEWGKIGMWAYAASRVLDALLLRPEIDASRVAVMGHSRLGKTALWCGAQDERFAAVISNDSGCGGAAIFRGKIGERVSDMERNGLWDWFCENFRAYAGRENDMPCDQHFLLACVAPRLLCVGSATLDEWADPASEFLACAAADKAYRLLGAHGLECEDRLPHADDFWREGRIEYHLRPGTHYLSRYDWNRYMAFWDAHV